jgi:hypothetical protein
LLQTNTCHCEISQTAFNSFIFAEKANENAVTAETGNNSGESSFPVPYFFQEKQFYYCEAGWS